MTLLRLDAHADMARTTDGDAPERVLVPMLDALPRGAPVVVMVHGFRFRPGHPSHDPHRHVLALAPTIPDPHALSWPRHLGLSGQAGLGIAFGWDALGPIWRVARRRQAAAEALAGVVGEIRRLRPEPVGLVAHSLGAGVALAAMERLPAGALGTVILMSGAAFRGDALRAMAAPAGRTARVVNVWSGENRLFDGLFEAALAPHRPRARSIGRGLGAAVPGWTDVRIDDAATRAALAALGRPVAPPRGRICHWSVYLRPGLFPLYRGLLGLGPGPDAETLARALDAPVSPCRPSTVPPRSGISAATRFAATETRT